MATIKKQFMEVHGPLHPEGSCHLKKKKIRIYQFHHPTGNTGHWIRCCIVDD